MVVVVSTEVSERSGIVTHDRRAISLSDSQLPGIVLPHAPRAASLTKRDTFSMHSMDALP
jgi:hypothetical protein